MTSLFATHARLAPSRLSLHAVSAVAACALAACALALGAPPAAAQGAPAGFEPVSSGTSYFVFAEPGAPTVEVLIVGEQIRNGVYKVQDGVTLSELLALAGGTARSTETERQIERATVRVLRTEAGTRTVVYEADPAQLFLEPDRHPDLETGDVIEVEVTYETVDDPFTLAEGLAIASRVASIATAVLLLVFRARQL